jgi:nitrite reductase/ring-hydroxylating ferredoxin subunit
MRPETTIPDQNVTDPTVPHPAVPDTDPQGLACAGGCDRRTVLSAGVIGAGALAVAACGTAGDIAGDAVSSASAAASGAVRDAIGKATIPVGGGKVFGDQKVVITQPTSGEFKAFTAVCTHQSCTVTDVSGGTINCSCHGSKFDIATGEVKQGPATKALPQKKVSVTGDGITVS